MARVAITAAMIRMVFRFSPATPMSIILARAVGSSMAVTAESSISAKRAATCFPLSLHGKNRTHSFPFCSSYSHFSLTGQIANDSINETIVS